MNAAGFNQKIEMPEFQSPVNLISMFRRNVHTNVSTPELHEMGGKTHGLLIAYDVLANLNQESFPGINIDIPEMVVIGTSVFDAFIERNNLSEIAFSPNKDSRIAHAFQQADLPFEILGDLRKIMEAWQMPLAIRSSGLLEDTMQQPFAGVYLTKMIPNNATNMDTRFQKLVEAIKFVWASTYFSIAKDYSKAVNVDIRQEKMAVIIQKMVGKRHQTRFYPEVSGVTRSYNFYPIKPAKPEDGVVNLALGLGKTVVDGERTWTYSPKFPAAPPPFKSIQDMLHQTQNEFWVVNMGEDYEYNPIEETEFMQKENLLTAEKDGVLDYLVSTLEPGIERLAMGTGVYGPRVLTFSPLLNLNLLPFNDLVSTLLKKFETRYNSPVEIEFAMTFNPARFSLLQVRSMKIQSVNLHIGEQDLIGNNVLIASKFVLGNGIVEGLKDIVYVRPNHFDRSVTKQIAKELEAINNQLLNANRPYILIVFGRLGSVDPWLGIPITWGKICGAKVIVEASKEDVNIELSQGSHYFHNIINLDVKYFNMPITQPYQINWDWFERQNAETEDEFTRHIQLSTPLTVQVDGKSGWGLISI